MHTKPLAKVAANLELEAFIHKKHTELKNQAIKNGKHFASKNLPMPKGDKLPPYVGDIKTAYEQLATEAHLLLQPGTHLPEGQIENNQAKDKARLLDNEIYKCEEKNKNDEYEMANSDSQNVWNRIFFACLFTGIILIGEIVFNAKAFEFSGENLLFALILSISVSFTVFVFSHIVPVLYKEIKTPVKRKIFIASILAITTVFFIALAVLRSLLLAQQQVTISPVFFLIINLFLFMVSVFLSYYLMPSLEEIKGSIHTMKLHKTIGKRTKEIEKLKREKDELKIYMMERAKQIIRVNFYTEYTNKRIEKMYHESVEIFKNTNLTFRTDRKVPDCFHDELPLADTSHLSIPQYLITNKQ